jgi:hypothetical protein
MVPRRTCRALAVAWAFMCVHAVDAAQSSQPAAQQTAPATTAPATAAEGDDGSKLPVSLDRIREGIQREPALKIDFLDPNIPLFRIHVEENAIKLEDYWKVGPDTAVSRMVRPSHASRQHHEFIRMTTPTAYLATVPMGGNPLHPVGPPIIEISKGIKKILSNAERGRIRRQIQEELKAIEANQAQQQQQQPEQTPAGTNGASKPVPNDPR